LISSTICCFISRRVVQAVVYETRTTAKKDCDRSRERTSVQAHRGTSFNAEVASCGELETPFPWESVISPKMRMDWDSNWHGLTVGA